jgi:hypothetical protein
MFHFTIRELILITLIAALGVAWSLDHRALTSTYDRETQRLGDSLAATKARLAEAEDLLEYEGVVMGDGETIHTTPELAAQLRRERAARIQR